MESYTLLIHFYALTAGLLIGSFLNVCICRLPLHETVVRGRSRCRSCGALIAWYDNVPVLSYFYLRGRCRHCGAPFPARYPLVEALNGGLYLALSLLHGPSVRAALYCLSASALLVAAFLDHDTGEVPDGVSVFLLGLGLAGLFFTAEPWWGHALGFVIISLPMLLLALLCDGFGGADIKLSAVCGLLLGWKPALLGALLASVSAAILGLFLLGTRRLARRAPFAFAPHLAFGFLAAELFGEPLIAWYLGLF